jgi:outer membrane receptor for ferrienterochelin and colicin
MREMRGLPDQYPLGLVVDGRVRAIFADSSEVARLDSAWSERLLNLAEVERIDVFRGDSVPARYKTRGLKQVYVFSTCRARESQ